jgi:hypothetical protein
LAFKGEKQANIYHRMDTVQGIVHLSEDHIINVLSSLDIQALQDASWIHKKYHVIIPKSTAKGECLIG